MNTDEKKKLYAALAAPFPESAIERSDGQRTGRGYDTTGIKYQFVVNRLNEVLGVGGYRAQRTITVKETATAKGRPAFEAICEIKLELGEWVGGEFLAFAEALGDGGHTSMSEADARKGSYTNAFKKAAAFVGVGRQAYEGTLDDDNVPVDGDATRSLPTRPAQPRPATPEATATSAAAQTARADASAQRPAAERNRLTSKQLNAMWAIAKGRGYDDKSFRAHVMQTCGAQPEFLTRTQASQLISSMTANGHDRQAGQDG